MFIIIIVLAILIVAILFGILMMIIDYPYYLYGTNSIKFKSFKSFYNINPGKWELHDDYVNYLKLGRYYYGYDRVKFRFNFIDYYRYRLWKHNLETQKRKAKYYKEYQDVLEEIKKDIAAFEENNAAETEKRLNDIWEGSK